MRDKHIIAMLENTPLASLSATDVAAIRAHTDNCSDCLQAFKAAQVSQLLLKERAALAFEPTPFFPTRVLATLRERRTVNDSWAFARLWRAAGALASSMVVAVATLAVLTFTIPGTQVASGPNANSLPNGYSAEEVILDQGSQPDDESDGQLLTVIYGGAEEPAR
jgi:hypothetical protein